MDDPRRGCACARGPRGPGVRARRSREPRSFRLVGADRRGPVPRGAVGAAFRGGDRRPGRGPAGRDPSRLAGRGRRCQAAPAVGVPVERRVGGGPDEAGGPSLPRRRRGGPPGRRVAALLRPHGADVGRLRGGAGARAGVSAGRAAGARRPDGEAVAPCGCGGRRSRRAPRGAARTRRRGRGPVGCAGVALCVRPRADACAYRAFVFAARARCRALGAPAAASVAVRRHAGRLVRLAPGRDAAALPGVRPGGARGGLQRVARRPCGRGPPGQGGPARRRRRRAGERLVGADPGRAGGPAGPA